MGNALAVAANVLGTGVWSDASSVAELLSAAEPVSAMRQPWSASRSATAAKRSTGQRREGHCEPGCTSTQRGLAARSRWAT